MGAASIMKITTLLLLAAATTTTHTLTLHIALPESVDPTTVRLAIAQETKGKFQTMPILSRALKAGERDVAIPDLTPGTYDVVVSGAQPLERLATTVKVEQKDTEATIAVTPFHVRGIAKLGERPIAKGEVGLNDSRNGLRWHAVMPIHDGEFGGVLWQHGSVHAWLHVDDANKPIDSPELGAEPSTWQIALKDRRIAGRIYDAETKEPIEGAVMNVQITTKGLHGYLPKSVQPDGSYSIIAAQGGTYELRVSAKGYVNDGAKFEVAEADDAVPAHDFAMSHGIATTIDVVTPSGAGIAGAMVIEGVNSDGHNPDRIYNTDASGRLTLQFRPNETRTLYILPKEGSFAIAHVAAARDDKPLHVVVPPPAASLKVTTKAWDDDAFYPVNVLRYNGELLPQPVSLRLAPLSGPATPRVYDRLPAGAYEVWSVLLRRGPGYAPLIGYAPPGAPVRVGLSTGEAAAEVVGQPLR
jgi:hypothetical protein